MVNEPKTEERKPIKPALALSSVVEARPETKRLVLVALVAVAFVAVKFCKVVEPEI